MKLGQIILASLALCGAPLAIGCAAETASDMSYVGTLKMPLSTISTSGAQYTLRNATLRISGTESATIISNDHIGETGVELDLEAGDYLIQLDGNWSLETTVNGETQTIKAQLVSPNPMPFTISDQGITDVRFQFRAGDDIILLGDGRVSVGFDVDDGISCGEDACGAGICCSEKDFESQETTFSCTEESACETVEGVSRATRLSCHGASDCGGTDVCCYKVAPVAQGTDRTECVPADECGTTYRYTTCEVDSDCNVGQACTEQTAGFSLCRSI